MAAERQGAFSASIFTLATFLAPALLAPGPIELANLAGVVFAVWMAIDVWRRYGRRDIPETFAHRASPAGPGVVASAALLFAVAIAHAWASAPGAEAAAGLDAAFERVRALWDFNWSPVRLLLDPFGAAQAPSPYVGSLVTFLLTAAVVIGALFGILALIAGVSDPPSLHHHALIWKGVRVEDAENALARRGAKGLKPIRDPFAEAEKTPVAGRLFTRAAALVVAVAGLAYAPAVIRLAASRGYAALDRLFESRLAENEFFVFWLPSLWAILLASALIYLGAYVRLGLSLWR